MSIIKDNNLKFIVDISKDIIDYTVYGFNNLNIISPIKIDYKHNSLYNCGYKEFSYE